MELKTEQEKYSSILSGADRKIHPMESPFAINQQGLWCKALIYGTDILSHLHTHDIFIYVKSLLKHVSGVVHD